MERGRDQDIQIRAEGIGYRVGEKWILRGIDLTLRSGKVYLLMGRNGSGKTTLLKILAGLIPPTEGKVFVDGEAVDTERLLEISGYVFQNPQTQVIGSTVEEDVAFGLENLAVPRDVMGKRVREVLEYVGLWEERCTSPEMLSGGQLQRLAIASVLVLDPPLLLMDEPLSMLDREGAREVAKLIERVATGKVVVIATHDPENYPFATDVICLENGRVMESCPF